MSVDKKEYLGKAALNVIIEKFMQCAKNNHTHTQNDITDLELLPSVSVENNGQFLRVVEGEWASSTIPSAEEVLF